MHFRVGGKAGGFLSHAEGPSVQPLVTDVLAASSRMIASGCFLSSGVDFSIFKLYLLEFILYLTVFLLRGVDPHTPTDGDAGGSGQFN